MVIEIGSDALQFCKRVKYLEKAWILISKDNTYHWLDQSRIPLDKLKFLSTLHDQPQPSHLLQQTLESLQREKDALLRQSQTTPRS